MLWLISALLGASEGAHQEVVLDRHVGEDPAAFRHHGDAHS